MLRLPQRSDAGNSTGRQGGSEQQAMLQPTNLLTNALLTKSSKENIEMRTKALFAVVILTAIVGLASVANAQIQFIGVGSSAMFNTVSAAAFTDLCSSRSGSDCRHWSNSGKNSADSQNWAQAVDSRNNSIPPEAGTFFVAWDNNSSPIKIWSYLSVDTIVGQRLFFAVPRATQQIDSGALTTGGANKVPAAILLNRQTGTTQADETTGVPSAVLSAAQTAFTAAVTDVRPEDAKFEVNRVLAAYNITGTGLGYGTASNATCFQSPDSWTVSLTLGCPIYGTWGGRSVPVQYALTGKDPFTNQAAWKYTTIPVGAEPVMFVYNATNPNGLGALGSDGNVAFKNLNRFAATYVFNGALGRAQDLDPSLTQALQGIGSNPAVFPILREPLSGTMTATEFNVFRSIEQQKDFPDVASQETGVKLANACALGSNCPDPLYLPGNGGSIRFRAIGTGAEISGVSNVGGVKNLADSIGYTFFSFGNVNPIAGASGHGRYVTLDGVDPINLGYGSYVSDGVTYAPGQLPACVAPCIAAGGTSLPNVRNGSYPAWTIIRAVTDATGTNLTNTKALIAAAQNEVNNTTADFVPYVCTDTTGLCTGEPGLAVFHSHFTIPTIATKAHNGNTSAAEVGGDVGGAVFTIQADKDFVSDTGLELLGIRK